MSPDYSWWYGYAEVLGHLGRIRDEAEQLRTARAASQRTTFMLTTGPIMVLVVLAILYTIWRSAQRRRETSA
jgi:hypothetical protein